MNMSNLRGFLAQNAIQAENVKCVVSKRFLDDDGKPMEWEIGCISSSENEALMKAATKRVPVVGKKNQFTQEMDVQLYLGKLGAKCTIFPNLDDAELQNSYGVMGSDVLLKTMLNSGEYQNYLVKIQEVNGFDTSFEDEVEEAKN